MDILTNKGCEDNHFDLRENIHCRCVDPNARVTARASPPIIFAKAHSAGTT